MKTTTTTQSKKEMIILQLVQELKDLKKSNQKTVFVNNLTDYVLINEFYHLTYAGKIVYNYLNEKNIPIYKVDGRGKKYIMLDDIQ